LRCTGLSRCASGDGVAGASFSPVIASHASSASHAPPDTGSPPDDSGAVLSPPDAASSPRSGPLPGVRWAFGCASCSAWSLLRRSFILLLAASTAFGAGCYESAA
jgi:hypothetical protein